MPPEPVPADPPPDPMTAAERAAWLDRVAEQDEPPAPEEWEEWPGPDDELTAEDLAELAELRAAAGADARATAEAGRRHVRNLEYRHAPGVAAPPLEVPACGRVRLRGRHYLHERVARREHRVSQAEPSHPWIVKGRRPPEGPAQLVGHLAAVTRHQRHLAQARSAQHTPTIGRPDPPRHDRQSGLQFLEIFC